MRSGNDIIHEPSFEHDFHQGEELKKVGGVYRHDECTLCGCIRVMGKIDGNFVDLHYERSHQIYSHVPTCWGDKNP